MHSVLWRRRLRQQRPCSCVVAHCNRGHCHRRRHMLENQVVEVVVVVGCSSSVWRCSGSDAGGGSGGRVEGGGGPARLYRIHDGLGRLSQRGGLVLAVSCIRCRHCFVETVTDVPYLLQLIVDISHAFFFPSLAWTDWVLGGSDCGESCMITQ